MSPNLLSFGQEVQEPLDLLEGVGQEVPAAADVAARVHRLLDHARTCVKRAQHWQKQSYDRRHRDIEIGVGEEVLLSTQYLKMPGGKKLAQRWIGPFRVQARVGKVAYRLELPDRYQFHNVFHVSLLKKYDGSGEHRGSVEPAPVVLDTSGEPEYEVEDIL